MSFLPNHVPDITTVRHRFAPLQGFNSVERRLQILVLTLQVVDAEKFKVRCPQGRLGKFIGDGSEVKLR